MNKNIKVHLLVNEVAANGKAVKADKAIFNILKEKEIPFDQQKSHYPGELTILAKRYANASLPKNNFLIVIGGDGSFNEALNGIKQSANPETPITYLPAGTGDDLKQLIDHLLTSPQLECVDCGYFCSNIPGKKIGYFVNNFGIGFDALIVHQSNHEQLKKKLNHLNSGNLIYGLNVIKALARQDTFAVTVKTQNKTVRYGDAYFATTTNHPYFGGGFAILPQANIHSHELDTIIVEKPSLRKFIFLFTKLLKDGSHVTAPEFHYVEAQEIHVETRKPEFAQIDGEDINTQGYKVTFKIDHFNLLK